MKTRSMEEMLVKAVRQFKREHKNAEFRTCYAAESSGYGFGKGYDYIMFHFEYVEEAGGEYKECYVSVNA